MKQEKQKLVNEIFTKVSKKYDFMNDLMSFGMHRIWKEQFINIIDFRSVNRALDLATGTGDILKLISKKTSCSCIGYDANINMIKQAQKKINKRNVFFINGSAENIPFKNNCFDLVTVSFGLRNFNDIEKSLQEIKRVLKNKKKFYCLEFSQINNPLFRKIYSIYSKLIPEYGNLFAKNQEAYIYLIESIKEFPNQIQLTKNLIKAGFKNVEAIDILDGLACIHIAES